LGHIFSEEHNVKQKGGIVRWNPEGQHPEVNPDTTGKWFGNFFFGNKKHHSYR